MATVQTTAQNRNTNSAPRGGQAGIGLFGTPGFNAPRQPLPRTPRASRIKGALNSFSSDGLTAAAYAKPAAPASVPPVSTATTSTVHVRRGNFQAFVRLSEREQRPVEEVMGEWLADCANLIRQSDFADAYGDPAPVFTPAMRAAARASDERESRRTDADDHADFLARCGGEDAVGITLSIED